MKRAWPWIVGAVLAGLLAAGAMAVSSRSPDVAAPGAPAPRFALLDHDGLPFGPERLEGHWSLLFFGYTQCPDVCPLTLQLAHQARAQLASPPQLVFLSLDAERDTPANVKEYLQGFDASFLGVTGASDEVARLEDWVAAAHRPGRTDASGNARIDHGAYLYVIDPQTRAAGRIEGIGEPHALAERIAALTAGSRTVEQP